MILIAVGCRGRDAGAPPRDEAEDDAATCARLCGDEAARGQAAAECIDRCTRVGRSLAPSVLSRVVDCALSSEPRGHATHGDPTADDRCIAEAVASLHLGDEHRRAWATSMCDRMLRCQAGDAAGADVRGICISSSMHPPDDDARAAMVVVDALADGAIDRFARCLAAAPCPAPGKADARSDDCAASALGSRDAQHAGDAGPP